MYTNQDKSQKQNKTRCKTTNGKHPMGILSSTLLYTRRWRQNSSSRCILYVLGLRRGLYAFVCIPSSRHRASAHHRNPVARSTGNTKSVITNITFLVPSGYYGWVVCSPHRMTVNLSSKSVRAPIHCYAIRCVA
jgi:hypothetical protein